MKKYQIIVRFDKEEDVYESILSITKKNKYSSFKKYY